MNIGYLLLKEEDKMYSATRCIGQRSVILLGDTATQDSLSRQQTPAMIPVPKPPKQLMNTIAETARLCGERNIGLNDSTLRYLCKNGMLPCIRVGKKTLINWNTLVNYLFSEDLPVPDEPKPSAPSGNGIRKIPAKIKR